MSKARGAPAPWRKMDSAELKALQAPLKARYRDDPSTALVTLRSTGTLGEESVACTVAE